MNDLEIDTDKSRLDLHFISKFISDSYWAKGRTLETMKKCIDNSLNFGVYIQDRQIGFARLVTDYAQFAYIMDLFIDEAFRGKGYSKALVKFILELDTLQDVKVWRLATKDAHSLYRKFGFDSLAQPDYLMELFK